MSKKAINLRGIVLTWTVLITTFFWTSTMRLILKPEISSWRIMNSGGKGATGQFWLLPLIVLIAAFLFYLEGRGKLRLLYHILLMSLHLSITATLVYGSTTSNSTATFGAWGIKISFLWLSFPFILFSLLALFLVVQESRGYIQIPHFGWNKINLKKIGFVVILFPVALILFSIGEGFNLIVKIAIIITIIQWILLTEGLGRPNQKKQ